LLPAFAVSGVQFWTTVVALTTVLQVVDVQPFAAVPVTGEHDSTGVGPVAIGAGQVTVVQLFDALGD